MRKRAPGAPSAALPGIMGFTFLACVAPMFYVMAFLVWRYPDVDHAPDFITPWMFGSIVWVTLTVAAVLVPAARGYLWAVHLLRWLSVLALLLFLAMLLLDAALFAAVPGSRQSTGVLLLFPLAPLLVCAILLLRALWRQPWFNPAADAGSIGPAYGSGADLDRLAGLDPSGQLPPAQLAAALAEPTPPPRWLCYLAPPLAALRLRRWLSAALLGAACLLVLAAALLMPLRAIPIYFMLGAFADRQRGVAAYRQAMARLQEPERPAIGSRRLRGRA